MSQLVNKGNDFAKLSEKHPPASLYVGELAPTVTEAVLYEHFKNAGTIASIRICRFNQKSNGYAYVNFLDAKDAERALEILNHSDIQGKPCCIMWQKPDDITSKSGVFVENLPLEVGPKDLSDAFSPYGDILSTKIAKDEKGLSKGFGFVHFAYPGAGNAAMDGFIKGDIHFRSAPQSPQTASQLVVKQFIPKKEWLQQRIQQRASTWTNVFVKNLNSSVTDQQLIELFSVFGKITSGVVMKEDDDGSSKCFGFVDFETHKNAERAAWEMHEKEFEGRKLWCGPAQKKSERWLELERQRKLSRGKNLYIKNFDEDLTEEKLRQYFSKEAYGEITSVKIADSSRCFGYISFETPQGTAIALNEMNGRPLPGSRKPLYVAYHEPKAIRQKKLQTRFANRTYAKSRSPAPMAMYPYYSQYPVYPQPNPRRPNTWPAPHAPYPVPQMQPYQPQPPMQSRPKPTRPPVPAQAQPAQPIKRGTQTRKPMIQTESGEVPLTIGALAKYPEEQQRLLLGERLYPIIQKTQPTLAGKITGMLLDSGWKIEDLLSLLYDEDKLNEKVADAAAILEKVNTTNQ
eukprot:TRINITY_DN4686_c0_g1_i3.p1 TRINITY_DN4686_c0_g1~~TRINITY_DN4686_c0_g1_i3.p1  ORF type:complete len:572 (-),score=74.67 TRINITY_DN4686_c0_g1_i3:48-1763(-)